MSPSVAEILRCLKDGERTTEQVALALGREEHGMSLSLGNLASAHPRRAPTVIRVRRKPAVWALTAAGRKALADAEKKGAPR